jgi:hypothetical protein
MAEKRSGHFHSPTEEDWEFAIDMLKRSDSIGDLNFEVLLTAVNEAEVLVQEIKKEKASRPSQALAKRKMRKLQKLFENLEFELKSPDSQQALRETIAATYLTKLLSSNAVEQIPGVIFRKPEAHKSWQTGPKQNSTTLEPYPRLQRSCGSQLELCVVLLNRARCPHST